MRSRSRFPKRTFVALVIVFVIAVTGASLLIPDYGDNRADAGSLPPQAAHKIAQKNDNAAMNAAAAMRARSAHDARIADAVQDQQDRANAAQPTR
jgi:hypothetical protein